MKFVILLKSDPDIQVYSGSITYRVFPAMRVIPSVEIEADAVLRSTLLLQSAVHFEQSSYVHHTYSYKTLRCQYKLELILIVNLLDE